MRENKYFFSVITVCYNSEKTIEKTLQSLLAQTYQNFEYIIVDGASKDSTLDIVKRYQPLFGEKMRIVSEPDKGIYDAMNKGIAMATGDIVGIVNSDDFYEPEALEIINRSYDGGAHEILYGMQNVRTLDGRLKRIDFYHHDFLESHMINHPACFITRDTYTDFGLYSLAYRSSSDLDFLLNRKQEQKTTFIPVYEILTNFTVGGESSGAKGHMETFQIWYKNGYISRGRYYFLTVKEYLRSKMVR